MAECNDEARRRCGDRSSEPAEALRALALEAALAGGVAPKRGARSRSSAAMLGRGHGPADDRKTLLHQRDLRRRRAMTIVSVRHGFFPLQAARAGAQPIAGEELMPAAAHSGEGRFVDIDPQRDDARSPSPRG